MQVTSARFNVANRSKKIYCREQENKTKDRYVCVPVCICVCVCVSIRLYPMIITIGIIIGIITIIGVMIVNNNDTNDDDLHNSSNVLSSLKIVWVL